MSAGLAPALVFAGSIAPAVAAPLSAASASAQASATGQSVEVTSQTSETNQVMANPDGSFTLTSSLTPVRTLQNGSWVPIDTTLQTNSDGSLSPAATTEQMRFSGGGTGPAVQVNNGNESIAFSWPTPLPTPTVSGSTATYLSVLNGVDLKLTARSDSYSMVLVVHDATAAANPALSQLKLTTSATNLNLASTSDGRLVATDSTGADVFEGSTPTMWDSTINPQAGPTPGPSDPGSGVINTLGVSMPSLDATPGSASTTLTLTPPQAALTGPNVVYPLYIDPQLGKGRANFAVVFNNGWHYYNDTSNDLKVGYCGWSDCNGIGTGRTYLNFDTALLVGRPTTAHIYYAAVKVYEIHNAAGCSTSEPVDLYTSGNFDNTTTWPGPVGTKLASMSSANDSACNSAGMVTFDNATVVNHFQAIANEGTIWSAFALLADNESDANQWKRFASDGSGTSAAQISVTYAFPPSTPATLHINAINCTGTNYTNDSTPTLHAVAHDNNPSPQNILMHYHLAGPTTLDSPAILAASDADATWTASSRLADGNYSATAYAYSNAGLSPAIPSGTTSPFPFTVKTSIPATPAISTFDYPQGYWGAPAQHPGTITFTGSSDTAGFTYSFTSSDGETKPTTCNYSSGPTASGGMTPASGGSATITLPTTLSVGYHQIWVKAFDNAHNISGESSSYTFYVSPTIAGEGATRLEAETLAAGTPPISVPSGDYAYVESSGYWSNGGAEQLVANGPGQAFTFTFNSPIDATYALGVQVYKAFHFCVLGFKLDGTVLAVNGQAVTVDTYSATVASQYVQLGGTHLTSGPHTITAYCTSLDASSSNYVYNGSYGAITINNFADNGYSSAIDYFTAVPLGLGPFTDITSAMNNHGIANDNTTGGGADIGPCMCKTGISQQTLNAAGIVVGHTFSPAGTTGVTFTMPSYNSNGNDNVMSDGQTITLPTAVNANHVDLLVASTCGATALSLNTRLGITFGDGSYSASEIPSVPDWVNQSPTLQNTPQTPAATITAATSTPLPYNDIGANATPQTGTAATPVHLYVLTVPTQYNDGTANTQVVSVTLPTLGSSFTEACNSPTLHVLAITTDLNTPTP